MSYVRRIQRTHDIKQSLKMHNSSSQNFTSSSKEKYFPPVGISVSDFRVLSLEESEKKIKEYFKNNPFDVTNSNRFEQLVEEETIKLLYDEVEVSDLIKAHATALVKCT